MKQTTAQLLISYASTLNLSDEEYIDVCESISKSVPVDIQEQAWIYTSCPSCHNELSTHYGDGYYSCKEYYERCPYCNQRLNWIEPQRRYR